MILSLRVTSFPRWVIHENGRIVSTLNLNDSCAIENTHEHCRSQGKVVIDIRLSDGTYRFDLTGNPSQPKLVPIDNPTQQRFLRRDTGWSLSYLFDRNYTDFFLCLEEFVFPSSKSSDKPLAFQPIVLIDGEVVRNMTERRYNYSIYDLVSCCVNPENAIKSFSKSPMSEKINMIKLIVCAIGIIIFYFLKKMQFFFFGITGRVSPFL